eukprot:3500687-Lingulodinium_polyedra.AAC.1
MAHGRGWLATLLRQLSNPPRKGRERLQERGGSASQNAHVRLQLQLRPQPVRRHSPIGRRYR